MDRPNRKALINRQTPNCSDVPWLFDPAVFIDDDGKAYIYFGGGVPEGKSADPGSCRAALLGSDMVSLAGNPVKIDVPFFFEASLMNKINGKYVFSYCTNWSITDDVKSKLKIDRAVVAIMTGNNPMGHLRLKKHCSETREHFLESGATIIITFLNSRDIGIWRTIRS